MLMAGDNAVKIHSKNQAPELGLYNQVVPTKFGKNFSIYWQAGRLQIAVMQDLKQVAGISAAFPVAKSAGEYYEIKGLEKLKAYDAELEYRDEEGTAFNIRCEVVPLLKAKSCLAGSTCIDL